MHGNACESKAEYAPRSPYINVYGRHYESTMTDPSSNGGGDAHDAAGGAPEESPLQRPNQLGGRPPHLQRLLDTIDEALVIVGNET